MKIRCCGCSHTLWRSERSWAASQRRPDGPRRLPGRAPRRSWDRPSRPESALGTSRTRPRPLLGASPSVCRVTPNTSERSTATFSCFFVVSVPIFLDSDELFDRLFGGLGILDTTFDRPPKPMSGCFSSERAFRGFVVDPVARRTSLHVTVTPYALYIDATSSSLASKSV